MKVLFCIVVFFLAVTTARALSSFMEVLPDKPPQEQKQAYGFIFAVTTTPAPPDMVKFHVVITKGAGEFDQVTPYVALNEVVMEKQKTDSGEIDYVDLNETTQSVTAQRNGDSITCDFVLSRKSLSDPNLAFSFKFRGMSLINGKPVYMPAVSVYYIRLKNLSKN